jgi:uroporphyrinogen-III decarboxylase
MKVARERLGSGVLVSGNVDPGILLGGTEEQIRAAARATIDAAGGPGCHLMNVGHGVMQGTPEESVGYFVDECKAYRR